MLKGGSLDELSTADFPDEKVQKLMELGQRSIVGDGDTFTVVVPEQLGTFSKMAGVLAASGLEVVAATAYSEEIDDAVTDPASRPTNEPMAASQFTIQRPQSGPPDWAKVEELAYKALDGRVALQARLNNRAKQYARYRRRLSADPPRKKVVIDNELSLIHI